MNDEFRAVHFERKSGAGLCPVTQFGVANAEKVNAFHRSFPEYEPTPLIELNGLAAALKIKKFWVKDESFRFGLNAFKALGGSYAIGCYIAKRLGTDIDALPYERLVSEEVRRKLGELTFVTATDGNHGRGVAWTANRLGQKSVVYMPKGTARERLDNIRALGSDASITELSYDDAVRLANENAQKYGWVTVQDTAWDGYEEIPTRIMQGYATMAHEISSQLQNDKPTHIFLQAGVGSMAASICAYFTDLYGEADRPIITVVEPSRADCFYRTAKANDGKLHPVTENMDSIMAGLCCGEPCTIAWDILRDHADNFVTMPDYAAAKGMRILGNPLRGDPRVISGESGASTTGFVAEVMENSNLLWLRELFRLDESSKVLCISTEGDTDRENYRRIVWDGLFPLYM